ncbi:TIGR03032 family protein [soil metagenome]
MYPAPQTPDATIRCQPDWGLLDWLTPLRSSLIISTYQAGKVVLVSSDGSQLRVLLRDFDKPMGLAIDGDRIALATRSEIMQFANAPVLAPEFLPDRSVKYDALYLPRLSYDTNDLNVHDIAFTSDGLCFCATRFGCLAKPSDHFHFEPFWQPPFISELVPEDRCHLNGLAVVDGQPRYVTCLGATDTAGGWRAGKATGGVIVDVHSNEIIARGLSMPHSPRWHDGALWFLNSGEGELVRFDPHSGQSETVATLPAYLRGLAFAGTTAIVGMCQIREAHIFGSLPVQARHPRLLSGVAVIDLPSGRCVGQLEFISGCTEVYDVGVLPNVRCGMILNRQRSQTREAITAPGVNYWLRPENVVSNSL